MACDGCERRRQIMHAVKEKAMAHAAKLKAIRLGGKKDAEAQVASEQAVAATEQAEATPTAGQAADPRAAHGKRRVAKDAGPGTGKGRAQVQGVRKARGRA